MKFPFRPNALQGIEEDNTLCLVVAQKVLLDIMAMGLQTPISHPPKEPK